MPFDHRAPVVIPATYKPPGRARNSRALTVSIPADKFELFNRAAEDAKVGRSTFAARCIAYALSELKPVSWGELAERELGKK